MSELMGLDNSREVIRRKLRQTFDGRIVRKDLTKHIKEGANVKHILADNYVRPDEAQKILSVLRQNGSYTVIDKITVNLNIKKDTYEAEFSNLSLSPRNIRASLTASFAAAFGALCSLNMSTSKKTSWLLLSISAN